MKRRRHAGHMLTIEITPMIDVVFLLIVFFMTTAQFARLTRAEVDLPKEQGEQEQTEEAGLVINIMADGAIVIGDVPVELDDLEGAVREAVVSQKVADPQYVKLLLRADRHADSAHLNRVIGRLRQAGVGAARVATEVPR